ncbi:NUDIX hydrolase [Comamonas sp. lk]|uniref:NUDIX hydrolase n=1 Tax=Comamonas sp. lk TaxID=2201272 RepID=UPI000EAD8D54|nr:NUDIX hydrolase [Comamonas sp. lk]
MAYETRYCSHCANLLQWITAAEDGGDVARLRCPACGWTHWGNPTPVLAAVVEGNDGRVLLARNAQWQEGVFGLITGFMEAGESPEAGVCREVLEETGLRAKSLRLLCCSEFLRMNQVLIAYHVRVDGLPGNVRLSPELLEYRWQTPEESLCWPSGTGYALAEWIRQKGLEPRFGAFRPGQSPEPDPRKWPVRYWDQDPRFVVAPQLT